MRYRLIAWFTGLGLLLLLSVGLVAAQSGVRAVVVNDLSNVRTAPAIGATVIDTVSAGFVFENITARSGDNQWIRVFYRGNEGWVHLIPLTILEGNIAALPVADPRTIPYGGFESPRSGYSETQGSVIGAATGGLRVRAGPSTAYPTLANINYNQQFTITGRFRGNLWYQVNFENTLGWVSAAYVQIIGGDVLATPIDGIVAQSPPPSADSYEDYIGTLQFMLDRLNISQDALNQIRAMWTDAALNGRASCQPYPPRPTDMQIPVPLLAANYNVLDPLLRDFNDAMFNLRQAIDLFIEVCNQPGTANPVGQGTVSGALGIVNLADQQFGSLRGRLIALIPDLTLAPDQCLLLYNNKIEKLPLVNLGVIYTDEFTRRVTARGYCFNGLENQVINVQTLPIPPAEISMFVAVSALDNPADFISIGNAAPTSNLNLGPIILPRTTTYIVLMADIAVLDSDEQEGRSIIGKFAFRLIDTTFASAAQVLAYDEATASIVLRTVQSTAVTGTGGNTGVPATCPSLAFTCSQLFTCDEARACYQAGNFALDGNGDGTPCNEGTPNLCQ